MGYIHIAEEMYLSADELQYELGKMSMVKDKKTGKEKETFVPIYYYSTFDAVIKDVIKILHRRKIARSRKMDLERAVEEYKKITADFERRMDTMKANITKDLAFEEKRLESALRASDMRFKVSREERKDEK